MAILLAVSFHFYVGVTLYKFIVLHCSKYLSIPTRAGSRISACASYNAILSILLFIKLALRLRAGSHFHIRISISRHTQTQYDVDN